MEEKTYIKMCDCPEIQEQWEPTVSTSYHVYHKRLKRLGDFIYGIQWENSDKEELTWLPRQDDIQKMFKEEPFVLAGEFHHTMESFITGDPSWWTMEGLWLAFYMWKKHGKIWDGKEWVEEVLDN